MAAALDGNLGCDESGQSFERLEQCEHLHNGERGLWCARPLIKLLVHDVANAKPRP